MQVQFNAGSASSNGGILILLWLYFLAGPFILTQDLPVHIYSGKILGELIFSGQSPYSNWFELSPDFISNSFTQWAAVIPSWFISPQWIHRFFLLWMVTAGFRGMKAMLKTYSPGQENMAVLILPLLMPVLFLKGFSNFFFGIAFSLHAFSMIPELLKGKLYRPFILYSFLIVACHPLVLYFFIGISFCLIFLYVSPESKTELTLRIKGLAHLLPALVAGVVLSQNTQPLSWIQADATFLWEQLKTMQYWKWYLPHEQELYQVLLGMSAILVLLSFYYTRNSISWLFLGSAVGLMIVYFYAPSGLNENLYIHDRIIILMSICMVMGLAFAQLPSQIKILVRYLYLFAFIFLLWTRYDIQQKIADDFSEIKSAFSKIPEGSVVLPLVYNHQGNYAASAGVFLHATSLTTEKDLVFLDQYAAHTSYFPIRWKLGKDPYVFLGDAWEAQPPNPDLSHATELGVDYIVEVFPPEEYRAEDLVYSSKRVRLYQWP